MSDLSIFLNTEIKNSGLLSSIGNKGLAPVRYFFGGKTFQINPIFQTNPHPNLDGGLYCVSSFTGYSGENKEFCGDLVSSEKRWYKTALAVIALIPGLLISLLKLADYLLDEDVRKNHKLVKEFLVPIDRELGTFEKPIETESQLEAEQDAQTRKNRPTNAVIVHGDGHLTIKQSSGILNFKPQRIILEGAHIQFPACVHCNLTNLGVAMSRTGNWKNGGRPEFSEIEKRVKEGKAADEALKSTVKTVREALETPLEPKPGFTFECYNAWFEVPRPQFILA